MAHYIRKVHKSCGPWYENYGIWIVLIIFCAKLLCVFLQLKKHVSIDEGDCPLSEMKCPSSIFGCSFVVSV